MAIATASPVWTSIAVGGERMGASRDRLIILRGKSGESQAQIGKLLGVTNSAVSRWECGKNEIPAWAIVELSKHFGVSTDWLLGVVNENER